PPTLPPYRLRWRLAATGPDLLNPFENPEPNHIRLKPEMQTGKRKREWGFRFIHYPVKLFLHDTARPTMRHASMFAEAFPAGLEECNQQPSFRLNLAIDSQGKELPGQDCLVVNRSSFDIGG